MIKYLNKHVDKLAHYAIGNIIAFLITVILTFLNMNIVSVNVISFVVVALIAFWKEMVHDSKADEFDAIATVAGAMTILIIFNFF